MTAHVVGWLHTYRAWPPVRAWNYFTIRFGYRGIALLLFALAFIGIGLGLPFTPKPSPELFYSYIPIRLRMAGWVVCGIVAAVGAVSRKDLWQARGFAVLLVPLMGERLLSYVIALIIEPDTLRWLSGAAVWFLFSGIVTLIAAWPEPSAPPTPLAPQGDTL